LAVNGTDQPRSYNGTTVSSLTYSGDITTDGKETDVDGIHVHRNRVYLWDTAGSDFYFGATNAIQGAFTKFELSLVSQTGGNLILVNTISFDTGSGMDDKLAFILDTGEVLIYSGSDPSDASNWSLQGRYTIPAPLSVRSSVQFGGDIQVITRTDVISLLQFILSEGRGQRLSKLTGAIKGEANLHASKFGWQAIYFSDSDYLIYNVPNIDNSKYVQYLVNANTNAPCKLEGMNGKAWAVWDCDLYFAGDGVVYKAFDGTDDNGADRESVAQQAFTKVGSSGNKVINSFSMIMTSEGQVGIGHNLAVDYSGVASPSATTSQAVGTQWDTAQWDTFQWAGTDDESRIVTIPTKGIGRTVSSKITINVQGQNVKWYESNYVVAPSVARK
jgi:hypothetical protein